MPYDNLVRIGRIESGRARHAVARGDVYDVDLGALIEPQSGIALNIPAGTEQKLNALVSRGQETLDNVMTRIEAQGKLTRTLLWVALALAAYFGWQFFQGRGKGKRRRQEALPGSG